MSIQERLILDGFDPISSRHFYLDRRVKVFFQATSSGFNPIIIYSFYLVSGIWWSKG